MTTREKPSTGIVIIVIAIIAGMAVVSALEFFEGTCA